MGIALTVCIVWVVCFLIVMTAGCVSAWQEHDRSKSAAPPLRPDRSPEPQAAGGMLPRRASAAPESAMAAFEFR